MMWLGGTRFRIILVGFQTGLLEFTHGGSEVYEVLFLPEITRPEVVAFDDPRISP